MRFSEFYKGIGKSQEDQQGFATLLNCDIHTSPGRVKSNWLAGKNSGTTVTELCKFAVVVTNGDIFWFSADSGKIWKRAYAGTWSLVHTNTKGACYGAYLYNGYLYFASGRYLGSISEALASSQATWSNTGNRTTGVDEDWGDFGATTLHHSMTFQNLNLYICNAAYISSVNTSNTFTVNALDLPPNQASKSVIGYENDLVVGTQVDDNSNTSGVFRWDTYSDSWTVEDYLTENGVDMFIKADNATYAVVGINGSIYQYDGVKMHKILRLRDDGTDMTYSTDILPGGSCNSYGKPMINTERGVYSLYKADEAFPLALNIEYVHGAGQDITPGAMVALELVIFMAWKSGSTYGVDSISATDRANGIIVTPKEYGSFNNVIVKYSSLPAGTSIAISTKVDGGDWTAQTVITDTINKVCYFDGGLGTTNTLQAKVTMTSSGTSTPEIEFVETI